MMMTVRRAPLAARLLAGVRRMRFLLCIAALVVATRPAHAQVSNPQGWSMFGGPSVGLTNVGLLGGIDLSWYRAPQLYRFRLTGQTGVGTQDVSSLTELAFMLGRGRRLDLRQQGQRFTGGNWWSISLGAAVVNVDRGEPEPAQTTVGLAAEVQMINRSRLSLSAIGNLNDESSFAGVVLGLQLGRLPVN